MATKRQIAVGHTLNALIPAVPYFDAQSIRTDALKPHMRNLSPKISVWLTIVAYIRHQYTDYDALRDEGYDYDSARFFVLDQINEKLTTWQATRFLTSKDIDEIENI